MHSSTPSQAGAEDTKEVHGWLSPVDLRFREFASRDAGCLSRSTFAVLDQKNPLLKYALQSWPTFVDRSRIRELAQISVGMSRLIRSIPSKVFDNDPQRIARFYGIDEPFARIMLESPNGIEGALSRGDFVYTSRGFQCVEFNMTSNLGGWETGLLSGMLLSIPVIARFVKESGAAISCKNTFRLLLSHALEEALRDGLVDDCEFNMLVGTREAEVLARNPRVPEFLNQEHQKMLRQQAPGLRGTLSARNYSDLTVRNGALYDGPRRLHGVVERHVDSTDAKVFRCFKSGHLNLYNGPISWILSDKRNIALLSEMGDSGLWSAEERELIQGHVPWSRRVLPGETLFEGEPAPLEDLLRLRRERFVIKKARSLGGAHVAIGRFSSGEEWETMLSEALASGDWIAQEYVESRPFLFQAGEHGCCPHDVVWGPFVFGSRYTGAILRVQPKALEGIVNLTRGATEGIIFEVDDGTPELT